MTSGTVLWEVVLSRLEYILQIHVQRMSMKYFIEKISDNLNTQEGREEQTNERTNEQMDGWMVEGGRM